MKHSTYIWQKNGWPAFSWDPQEIVNILGEVRHKQGLLAGTLASSGFDVSRNAQLEASTAELLCSSAIENERLEADSVRSSIARHLGLETEENEKAPNHHVEGLVQVMMDASANYLAPLTQERLFGWHAALFPTGYSGISKIDIGRWRTGEAPMQVVSGAMGKERVHFEAPPSGKVEEMMAEFLEWVNTGSDTDPVVRAAVAHLWFVTIHPFDDGNGRLSRTITDMMLARADGMTQRFYSMSREINEHKKDYYEILERTQKGGMDITPWLVWFLESLRASIDYSLERTGTTLKKVSFWDTFRHCDLNARQTKVLNMLWDGFEGKLTSSKYAKIGKCSPDTALNDIKALLEAGALSKNPGGGRSTSYSLPATWQPPQPTQSGPA